MIDPDEEPDVIIMNFDGGVINNGKENALGSWAFSLSYHNDNFEDYGIIENATNNISELTAAIKGLQKIKNKNIDLIIYGDSQYVINGISSWVHGWIKNNWKTSNKEPVKNKNLWVELYNESRQFKNISWSWVRGHNKNPGNEHVDELCVFARENYLKTCTK